MKKILILLIMLFLAVPVFAVDKTSAEYLYNKKHFAPMNPLVECIAQKAIKKSLKKETGAKFKVKFEGYTLSSMKAGVFKNLEITGKNVTLEGVDVPYLKFKTLSEYNRIDYTVDPVIVKSDMEFYYELHLSEKSINDALKSKEYKKSLQKVNKKAYPLFMINDVRAKIKNNNVYIFMDYNFPINPVGKNKTFMVSTNFAVVNGIIKARDIGIDSAYGNMPLDKVTNLINLLDPLSFTLDVVNAKKCKGKIENVKIEDNIFQINGRMFVKGVNDVRKPD